MEEGLLTSGELSTKYSVTGIPNCSQYPLVEKPKTVAKKMLEFIEYSRQRKLYKKAESQRKGL